MYKKQQPKPRHIMEDPNLIDNLYDYLIYMANGNNGKEWLEDIVEHMKPQCTTCPYKAECDDDDSACGCAEFIVQHFDDLI